MAEAPNVEAEDILEMELQRQIEAESDDELLDDDIVPLVPLLMFHAEGDELLEKIRDFYEEVVPGLTNEQFKEQFRLTREAVRCILDAVGRDDDMNSESEIPLEKKLLLSLWYLGSVISFRKVAMVFGMSLGAAWSAVDEVVTLLVGLRDRAIALPPKAQLEDVMRRFAEKGFPGAMGAVDGCHIQVCRSIENEHAFVNRKHVHAINLMAVADDRSRFLDVCVGWPGSVHDSRVFKNSPLGQKLESERFRTETLPENSHILGDAAFQLSTYLITPFRENQLRAQVPGGPTPREKKYFNYKLSASRVVVEHAFGMLKGRFRRLGYVETKTVEKAVDIVCAACVLHNICLANDDEWEVEANQNLEVQADDGEADDAHIVPAVDGAAAIEKRNALVRQVWAQRVE